MNDIRFSEYPHKDFGIYGATFPTNYGAVETRFWFRKGQSVKFANVVFDESLEKISVPNETAILSLKETKSYIDMIKAVKIFLKTMEANQFVNIKFRFLVNNQIQKDNANSMGQELGIVYIVQDINQEAKTAPSHEDNIGNFNLRVVNTTHNQIVPVTRQVYVQEGFVIDTTNDEVVGIIGQGFEVMGDRVDYNGQPFAMVVAANTIQQTNNVSPNEKGNVRTRRQAGMTAPIITEPSGPIKASGRSTGRSAAFVNLPIIMFVLSSLILIISLILLFILD